MAGLGNVLGNLNKWAQMKRTGLEGLGKVSAQNMQNYARTNKRWKDITGNARAGLNGGSFWQNPFMLMVFIAHSMEYGIYLELANDGKYDILQPTVNQFAPKIHESAKRIMDT